MLASALAKWDRMKLGERVVIGDAGLEVLCDWFMPQDTDEAALYFQTVTIPNPTRCGILDAYLAYIRPEALTK